MDLPSQRLLNVFHKRSYPTSGPVSTGMGDRVRVQFRVRDIYLGMWPATQVNSAWPSLQNAQIGCKAKILKGFPKFRKMLERVTRTETNLRTVLEFQVDRIVSTDEKREQNSAESGIKEK